MKRRLLTALLAAALCLSLAGCRPALHKYDATFLTLFDTVTTVVGYGTDRDAFTAKAEYVRDLLLEYHRLYDIYHDYPGVNNVKTINDHAGIEPVEVDRRLIDLLLEARELYDLTGGKVNVAMGSVLSIWHEYREEGISRPEEAALPPMAELEAAAAHTDIDDVIIDEENNTVYLADPDLRLDVGAVAKGFAVERVCRTLEAEGETGVLLSVGGNVRAVGPRADGAPWRVSLQDPKEAALALCDLAVSSGSVVTSGDYQRYYTVDGVRYHHIIDPATLMPAAYFTAVTILAADSGLADGLSTALFNMSYEEGAALVEKLDGVEVLWVFPDGSQRATEGFQRAVLSVTAE